MLHRDKIGDEFLLAFDESQAMLVLISCEKVCNLEDSSVVLNLKTFQLQLHVFIHDDSRGFTASGSAINLNSWYGEGTTIKKACFTSGSEELLLVDSQAIARVFSLTTMQFRCVLSLKQVLVMTLTSSQAGFFESPPYTDRCPFFSRWLMLPDRYLGWHFY